ncbi:MAG: hypothetical protein WC511_00870 [Candidatus Pacearchaeota archaeon]|jgi:uncharacterized membrane protein
MNKKGQQQSDIGSKILLLVIAFILAGIVIYFLGNVAIWVGVASLVISIILFIIACQTNEDSIGYFSLFLFGFAIVLLIGGFAIANFFENNEVGKLWLGSGKTIVNTTTEAYKTARGVN